MNTNDQLEIELRDLMREVSLLRMELSRVSDEQTRLEQRMKKLENKG